MSNPNNNLELKPFRRRIRLLRAWRLAAIGGCAGAGIALILVALDFFGVYYVPGWAPVVPVALGILLGAAWAIVEKLPDAVVARSMDRRGGLEDRLATAAEVPESAGLLAPAQHEDAAERLAALRPSALYPLRAGRWQGSLLALSFLTALIFALGNSAILKTQKQKHEAAEMKSAAAEVRRVTKPTLQDARLPHANAGEQELARRLDKFQKDLDRGRMSKQEALVKANILAEESKKLEEKRGAALAQTVKASQTAAAKLNHIQANASLEKSDAMKLAGQAAGLENQIGTMQKELDAAQAGKPGKPGERPLSKAEQAALEKKLAEAKEQLRQVRLSQQAQEFLEKLHANKDYQEAQRLMEKLAQQATAQQSGAEQTPMTQEQLDAAAKRLEEMAKEFSTDEKLKELAAQMLAMAKAARSAKPGQGAGLLGAFGLGGFSSGAQKGAGAPSQDRWIGPHGKLPRDDKSSLLHVKFEDRVLTSQRGDKGPETYTEVVGPAAPSGKSSVPFQQVLPKYEKSAESALKKSDIPPSEQAKVRDYFDSLRK
jgi:hypothetical protein